MRVSVEKPANLLKPFSDLEPPERATEIQHIGLNTKATRLFHLQCLDELLSYDNGPGLRAFAERLFPEPRPAQRGPLGTWQPKDAERYIIETWKAVQVHRNSRSSNPTIKRGLPSILLADNHNYHLRIGPDNTLFETKEAFDLYSKVANLAVPAPLRVTMMPDRTLYHFLHEKRSVQALQQIIDTSNQTGPVAAQEPLISLEEQKSDRKARIKYFMFMGKQGVAGQAPTSYYFQDKTAEEANDIDIALKLGHWDSDFKLSQWLPSSMNEAERHAAMNRERYGVMAGLDLEVIGEEGPVMGVVAPEDMGEEFGEEDYVEVEEGKEVFKEIGDEVYVEGGMVFVEWMDYDEGSPRPKKRRKVDEGEQEEEEAKNGEEEAKNGEEKAKKGED